jgi:two-component system, OmpR family, response regulator QseB
VSAAAFSEDVPVDEPEAQWSRPARLLLVEDDPRLSRMLTGLLAGEGYHVDCALDGQRGLHLGLTREYEVMMLDRGLPAIDGLDLLARLRSKGVTTPALVLSALGNPSDRVEGLDAGAEDYLAKPFDVDELLARLRALRRRHRDTARLLQLTGGSLDIDSRQVRRQAPDASGGRRVTDDEPVQLSARECSLLAALAARPTRVFSRGELLGHVFEDAESEVVVDTYVHYLRRKLGRGVVRTVRGRGYQMGRL